MNQQKEINFENLGMWDIFIAKCRTCGSLLESSKCMFCGNKYPEIEKERNILLTTLETNMSNNISLNLETVPFFQKLLEISKAEYVIENYPTINLFIDEQHLHSKIDAFYNTLSFKFRNEIKIDADEELLLKNLLKAKVYGSKLSEDIMKYILIGKKVIDYETFEEYIKCFVEATALQIKEGITSYYNLNINDNDLMCTIEKTDSNGDYCHFYRLINISPETVKRLYDRDITRLATIFHELRHYGQFLSIDYGICNPSNLMYTKDSILKKILANEDYYNNNYYYISYEADARAIAYSNMLCYLDELSLKVSNEARDAIFSEIDDEIKMKKNNLREVQGTEMSLNDLFEVAIENHPEYYKKYNILSFEYKEENGKIIPKTIDELIEAYNYINYEGEKRILDNRITKLSEKQRYTNVEDIEENKYNIK